MNDPRLQRLQWNFAALSLLAACLLGLGRMSLAMPGIIAASLAASTLLTDRLGIIRLGRLAAYLVMLCGALIAILEHFFRPGVDELMAVAKLLIYVQVGLMFQPKTAQVYEHWAIFLLLQLIVASLLNDNLLFGLLLIPVLFLGCSTLLAYCALTSGDPKAPSPGLWGSFRQFAGKWSHRSQGAAAVKMRSLPAPQPEVLGGTRLGVRRGAMLATGVMLFAIAFFFTMPRLKSEAYEGAGWNKAAVGFTGTVSLQDVGELLETDALALKLRFTDVRRNVDYLPKEPPYIRGSICSVYVGEGKWKAVDQEGVQRDWTEETPAFFEINPSLREAADDVEVTVEEQAPFATATFNMPPHAKPTNKESPLRTSAYEWRLIADDADYRRKDQYSFRSYAFINGVQSRVLPLYDQCLRESEVTAEVKAKSLGPTFKLTAFSDRQFPNIVALKDRILARSGPASTVGKVLMLEDYLVSSPEFQYSLVPSPNRNPDADPIEDFVGNHKTGHCQYYVSAMTLMLRSMNIPSRIVLGFRPNEYNQSGYYFLIRQKHAHSWVEAYLPVDEMRTAGIEVPEAAGEMAWLRLDPTPPGENSNAGGSIRGRLDQLENLQQLWKELVMDADSSNQLPMLQMLTEAGEGSFTEMLRSAELAVLNLQSNQLVGGLLSPTSWFSWQAAVGLAIASLLALGLYQIGRWLLQKLGLWRFGGRDMDRMRVQTAFYRRVVRALGRLRLRRAANQTPLEFARSATVSIGQTYPQRSDVAADLEFLTDVYYRLRFGFEESLPESDWNRVERATENVESLAKSNGRGAAATGAG